VTFAAGTTTISATSGAIVGSTSLTVTSATLQSIAVTPATQSIALGATHQFTATGTYSDNSTQDVTTQVTWFSSRPNVAIVSNTAGSQGLVSAVSAGMTTLRASAGMGLSGSATVTVP
jgi:uncharacterized protein YjdB